MNSSSPRVLLVGCGGIARAHLCAIPAAHIVGLCDSSSIAAHRLLADFELDAPLFDSINNAIKYQKPDVAIICTPPATHFDLVKMALEEGVNVLCEKPLALSTRDANSLVETARQRNLRLRTCAKYRFCAGVEAAKSLLDSSETGALQHLFIAFGAPFDYTHSWHSYIPLSGGGVWMDNGPHALDLARYFAGELHLETLKDWQAEAEIETDGHVRFRSEKGVPVEITLSWRRTLGPYFAILECERGTLKIGWKETLWYPRNSTSHQIAANYNKAECFFAQWHGFLTDDPRLSVEDGAHAVELIETIYNSARTNTALN